MTAQAILATSAPDLFNCVGGVSKSLQYEKPECLAHTAIAHLMIRIWLICALYIKKVVLFYPCLLVSTAWPRLPTGAQLLAAE